MDGFHRALGEDRAGVLAVLQAGMDIGLEPDELAVIIERESGWNPRAVNPDGKARGLIQLRPIARKDIGMEADPITLSRTEQAPWIQRFYQRVAQIVGGPIPHGDLYLATFRPSAVGKPDSYVIAAPYTDRWKNNAVWLRESPKGPITAGSVRRAGSAQGFAPPPPTPQYPVQPAGDGGLGAMVLVALLGVLPFASIVMSKGAR
jgi:hypothetical protein